MKRKRTAKYRRVSHKEQFLKGFSIETQGAILDEFAKNNNLDIVGDYVDEGFSASSSRRPAMQRLLDDVRLGQIDLIIFTKLDRWFRSVSQYYKIQDILDENGTAWRTALEDYETESSGGKFKVNIMLSVAQNEIDKTSERIKEVFDYKVSNGQPVTGAQPTGYIIQDGKIIKDPKTEKMMEDIFDTFEREHSIKETLRQIHQRHNVEIRYNNFVRILSNRKYTGEYRGNPNYYPAYLSVSRFEHLQTLKKRNIPKTHHDITYVFSKLLRCGRCGHTLTGHPTYSPQGVLYKYYRCAYGYQHELCSQRGRISEKKFEKALLDVIEDRVKDYIIHAEQVEEYTPEVSEDEILEELERLNKMYQKRRISEEVYDMEYEQLQSKLDAISKNHGVNKNVEKLIETGFREFYESLPPEDKRLIWRSVIDKIIVHSNTEFEILFL